MQVQVKCVLYGCLSGVRYLRLTREACVSMYARSPVINITYVTTFATGSCVQNCIAGSVLR
jgi:hypothetical protein